MKSWPDPSWAFLGESSQQAGLCACSLWCLPGSSIKWLNCFKNNRGKKIKKGGGKKTRLNSPLKPMQLPGSCLAVGVELRAKLKLVSLGHFSMSSVCACSRGGTLWVWPGMQNCCKIYTSCVLRLCMRNLVRKYFSASSFSELYWN